VAEEYAARHPEVGSGYRILAAAFVATRQLDHALALFEKSEALEPLDFVPKLGRRSVLIQQHRWTDLDRMCEGDLLKSPSPFLKFLGLACSAWTHDVRGRGQAALAAWDQVPRLPGISAFNRAVARNRAAAVLLRDGHPAAALTLAQQALADAAGRDQEFETLQILAIAQAALGRKDESDTSLARLAARADVLPSPREKRRVHWRRGQIALNRGDTAAAVAEYKAAVDMLPPFGPVIGPPSAIAALLFDAASAFTRGGQDEPAAALLERLQTSHDLVFDTDGYGRSHYLLAQIYERRKDMANARDQYTKFLDLWRDGDRQRGWVAEATRKLAR
jgi:tetratricopeptide (TPR) repeat protein